MLRQSTHILNAGDSSSILGHWPPLPWGLCWAQRWLPGPVSPCPRPGAGFALPLAVEGGGRCQEEGTSLCLPVSGWRRAEFLRPCLCSWGCRRMKTSVRPWSLACSCLGLGAAPRVWIGHDREKPGFQAWCHWTVSPCHSPPPHEIFVFPSSYVAVLTLKGLVFRSGHLGGG